MFSPTPRPSTADRGTHRRRPSPVPIACAVAVGEPRAVWGPRAPSRHPPVEPSQGGSEAACRLVAPRPPHRTPLAHGDRHAGRGPGALPAPTLEPRDGAAGVTLRGIERQ